MSDEVYVLKSKIDYLEDTLACLRGENTALKAELAQQTNNKWFDATVQLPDKWMHVLIRSVIDGVDMPVHYEAYLCGDGSTWTDWCGDVDDGVSVTHWMMLPAPPNAESSGAGDIMNIVTFLKKYKCTKDVSLYDQLTLAIGVYNMANFPELKEVEDFLHKEFLKHFKEKNSSDDFDFTKVTYDYIYKKLIGAE